ncbi:MAG: hypothetical protein GY926_19345 [bacterium]|nr:hypothetical protein [bacterium]
MTTKAQRSATLTVTNPSRRTVIQSADGQGVLIQFDVMRTIKPEANTAAVTILNLSQRTRDTISDVTSSVAALTPAQREAMREYAAMKGKAIDTSPVETVYDNLGIAYLKLEAGYQGGRLAQILEGSSSKITHTHVRNTWRSEIFIGDAQEVLRDAYLGRSYKRGTPVVTIISDLANAFGAVLSSPAQALIANKLSTFPEAQVALGGAFIAHGPAFALMQEWMRILDIDWTMQDGELLLLSKNPLEASATLPDPPLAVSQVSGMIGRPRRLEGGGVELVTLLEPEAKPGRRCALTSRYITGSYRIEQVRHSGDTRSGPWYSTMELSSLEVL